VADCASSREWIQAFLTVAGSPPTGVPVRSFVLACSGGSAKLRDLSDSVGVHALTSVSNMWLDKRTSNSSSVMFQCPLASVRAESRQRPILIALVASPSDIRVAYLGSDGTAQAAVFFVGCTCSRCCRCCTCCTRAHQLRLQQCLPSHLQQHWEGCRLWLQQCSASHLQRHLQIAPWLRP